MSTKQKPFNLILNYFTFAIDNKNYKIVEQKITKINSTYIWIYTYIYVYVCVCDVYKWMNKMSLTKIMHKTQKFKNNDHRWQFVI